MDPTSRRTTPLAGRVAVVTGASRARGIGAAVVRRLVDDGHARSSSQSLTDLTVTTTARSHAGRWLAAHRSWACP